MSNIPDIFKFPDLHLIKTLRLIFNYPLIKNMDVAAFRYAPERGNFEFRLKNISEEQAADIKTIIEIAREKINSVMNSN